jgi:hypothetical protein
MSDGDTIVAALLSGVLGYTAGAGKYSNWDDFIKRFNESLGHTTYLKIKIPYKLFEKSPTTKVLYIEATYAHLLGYPNSSLSTLMRVLEIGLRLKYKENEGKDAPEKWGLFDLIEWAENILKDKTEIAHGFRILRNLIHTDKLISEQDNMEAIRHVSVILNEIFPYDSITVPAICPTCNISGKIAVLFGEKCNLGVINQLQCDNCYKVYTLPLIP